MEKDVCGIYFYNNDIKDITGCLKEKGYNNAHICQTKEGEYYEWEDNYKCTCGCWDAREKTGNFDEVCVRYSKISTNEALDRIKTGK